MALPSEKTYWTYADYLQWDEPERIELIDGEAVMMAGPTYEHQLVSSELVRQFGNFLVGKPCQVLHAPFDVRLFEKEGDKPEDVDTVVQPDIMVICDKNKLDEHGCKGAPDMVIEILSPSNFRHDRIVKLNLYNEAGVREYWIVDPLSKSVQVFLPDENGKLWIHEEYTPSDIAKVNVLVGCFIELCKVFPENK